MSAQMRSQVEVETEFFAAESALERLFAGVDQLVPFEFRVVEEAFVAAVYWTNVLAFSVGH